MRELKIAGLRASDLDVTTVRALTANPNLASFAIVSIGQGLTEDGFGALSQSNSLTKLLVPMRAAMHALGDMKTLKHLEFSNATAGGFRGTVDLATARSIARLPALESIRFPYLSYEAGALAAIFNDGPASQLEFGASHFFANDESVALMANTQLRSLHFPMGMASGRDREALLNHPTIDRVQIRDVIYTRVPGSGATLTPAP